MPMKTMNRWWMAAVAGVLVATAAPTDARAELRIGAGVNYWVMLDDIEVDDIDESGFSYLATLQLRGDLLGLGVDVELMPDRFGEDVYSGQAYLIVGKGIYGAAGIGIDSVDGEFADDPFFSLRLGLDLELLTGLHLDISANYRFNEKTNLDDLPDTIDTDTIFLGAALRLAF
jgi:hypothetical protein